MKPIIVVIALALLAGDAAADTKEPLTIKGVAIGDPMEKIVGFLGACTPVPSSGACAGKISYGPVDRADFLVNYAGGRVTSASVSFLPLYSPEILAGLTKKYGKPLPKVCKEGGTEIDCYLWTSGDTRLMLMDVGLVELYRPKSDNY